MRKEVTVSAKTVDEAVLLGAEKLGKSKDDVKFEVIEDAKRGFMGMGAQEAKVLVFADGNTADNALAFVNQMIKDMELDATATMEVDQKDVLITIDGKDVGVLIGHHGETLDAIQYLTNLAANKKEEGTDREYMKITVDIENYRAKREDTLCKLARRIASKVAKYGRSVTLEPMPPHERRIIHAEVQNIEGVTTNSIGEDSNRRVVIFPEGGEMKTTERRPRSKRRERNGVKVQGYGTHTNYAELEIEDESDGISLPKTVTNLDSFEKHKSVADYFGDNESDYESDEGELENKIDTDSISLSSQNKYHNEFSIYDLDFKFKSDDEKDNK